MRYRIDRTLFVVAMALGSCVTMYGCQQMTAIPIFNTKASLVNRTASAEELLIEVTREVSDLRDAKIITQEDVDKTFKPKLAEAESIIKSTRAIAHAATTRPTTIPSGSLDDAKAILLSIKDVLKTLEAR